ncbi:GGDEF domain-containing protein [Fundidesulfovibrio soli]|uniref:GGDEF domain-containing protein n=1 Tax=Fundidesulfovibrio soli TaxID=2922716 RepID=UPI001FAFBBEB|nr:GGDEF domain-containing protein [Fundidesulfovibrio soli]
MPGNKPPQTNLSQRSREVLEELTRLRGVLEHQGLASIADGEDGLILVRLCMGLNLDEWEHICREGQFQQWLALPAKGDATRHLSRIQRTLEELTHQTRHDPLTGLANRRAFEKTLKMELERAHRAGNNLSLAILDLDDFKAVNDNYGHICGDRVLTMLAGIMLGGKRGYDLAARIGGEEFALVLPGSGLVQAEASLERMFDALRDQSVPCDGAEQPVRVTCSAGVVCTKGKLPLSVDQFVAMADKALYEAKAQGKNRIVKAPIPDLLQAPQATLVHAQEKQFLFTGPDK